MPGLWGWDLRWTGKKEIGRGGGGVYPAGMTYRGPALHRLGGVGRWNKDLNTKNLTKIQATRLIKRPVPLRNVFKTSKLGRP